MWDQKWWIYFSILKTTKGDLIFKICSCPIVAYFCWKEMFYHSYFNTFISIQATIPFRAKHFKNGYIQNHKYTVWKKYKLYFYTLEKSASQDLTNLSSRMRWRRGQGGASRRKHWSGRRKRGRVVWCYNPATSYKRPVDPFSHFGETFSLVWHHGYKQKP